MKYLKFKIYNILVRSQIKKTTLKKVKGRLISILRGILLERPWKMFL